MMFKYRIKHEPKHQRFTPQHRTWYWPFWRDISKLPPNPCTYDGGNFDNEVDALLAITFHGGYKSRQPDTANYIYHLCSSENMKPRDV